MTRPSVRADLALLPGYHSPQVDVEVRLNTNESPYAPPDAWYEQFAKLISDEKYHRYPDREAQELRRAIADQYGLSPENVFCGNGSNEVLQVLLLAYGGPGRRAVTFEPTYAMHSHIARITNTEVVTGQRADDFTLPASELQSVGAGADLLFLCSPNNPTGVIDPPSLVEGALSVTDGIVVVDEAYGQFADWSARSLLDEDRNLVVTRTFSKTWAMAGARLGYLLGPTWLVHELWKTALPYHLSTLTQVAGTLALQFQDEMQQRVASLVSERERLQSALAELRVTQWPSQSNFILFRPDAISGSEVWQRLLDRSVLVRNCDTWPGLKGCLRVTVGTPQENDRFLSALKEALA